MGRLTDDPPGQAVAARLFDGVPCCRLHRDPAGGAIGLDKESRRGIVDYSKSRLRIHHARREPGVVPGDTQRAMGVHTMEIGPDEDIGLRAGRFPVHTRALEYSGAEPGQRFRIDNDAFTERIRHTFNLSESDTCRARSCRASYIRSSGCIQESRCSAASLRASDLRRCRPPRQPAELRSTASRP